MNPESWHIRSLRRFEDNEIALAIYFCLGGVFSLIYTAGAIWNAKLYVPILNGQFISHYMLMAKLIIIIIVHAIIRVMIWAPDMFWHVVVGHQSFTDWLFAADILKDMV